MAVDKLNAGLDPVALVDTNHQASLMVEFAIFPVNLNLSFEIAGTRLVPKWAVIPDETIVRRAPVVGARGDGYGKSFRSVMPRLRRICPLTLGTLGEQYRRYKSQACECT